MSFPKLQDPEAAGSAMLAAEREAEQIAPPLKELSILLIDRMFGVGNAKKIGGTY